MNGYSIKDAFEIQVERTPEHIAVKTTDGVYTYKQLNGYANAIAHLLLENRRGKDESERVSLLFDHGPHMIAAILGTLKAGLTYVPLSTDYPENRLTYMVENSESSILLSLKDHETVAKNIAEKSNCKCLTVKDFLNEGSEEENQYDNHDNPSITIQGNQLAYIMYTSGSTGRPKGVMQNHENVLYYTRNWVRIFSITEKDRLTLFSSFCHDGSVQDMLSALLTGAALYPMNVLSREGAVELSDFLITEKITIWHSVPSLYSYFLNTLSGTRDFEDLRYILLGGEAVRKHEIALSERFFPKTILANVYGQTESSVNCIRLYPPGEAIEFMTIGEPLDATEIMVLDEDDCEVEEFEVGEIMVACRHITPGYWKNEEASEKTFNDDPDLGRVFFTGDLGRLLPGGGVEFMGRRDSQVKIRGYRIELGEIESQCLKHPEINEAVVIVKENKDGEKNLCCYFVPRQWDRAPGDMEVSAFLAGELPDYMLPTFFVTLEKFPLTQSGKIDRNRLPEPGDVSGGADYAAPRDTLEETLVRAWREILLGKEAGETAVGIDDNFFRLGGHSLKATTMVSRLHRELDVKIPVVQVFKTPTIRGLADFLKEKEKEALPGDGKDETPEENEGDSVYGDTFSAIPTAPLQDYYPLSSAQNRLYILQQMDDTGKGYNLPGFFRIEGLLDKERLENAFQGLVRRHESLRTFFPVIDDEPFQQIGDGEEMASAFKIQHFSIDRRDNDEAENAAKKIVRSFVKPFDLTEAPLIRVGLITLSERNFILMLDMHHIVTDGISFSILLQDMIAFYEEKDVAPLNIQFKDYCLWQLDAAQKKNLKKQENYWVDTFSREIPVLNLPADFRRPDVQGFEGNRRGFTLDKEIARRIRAIALSADSTMYMTLLAVYTIFLAKLSGQEDIIVGTVVGGRNRAELQQVVGMFVNTLPLWNRPANEKTFDVFLKEVKNNTLQAFENQDYLFEDLVEKVTVKRDISRNPIFDVMFRLQNFEMEADEISGFDRDLGLQLKAYDFDNPISKFDLSLTGVETSEHLWFKVEYSTNLFTEATINRYIGFFKQTLSMVLDNPGIGLERIEIIGSEEKQRILNEFNDTAGSYPKEKTIHGMFLDQVNHNAGAIALRQTDEAGETVTMTYGEMERKTAALASLLISQGLTKGSIVAIMVERSMEMMLGIFAILRAGAVYLPMLPEYPEHRKEFLLKDSNAAFLLTQERFIDSLEPVLKMPPAALRGRQGEALTPPPWRAPGPTVALRALRLSQPNGIGENSHVSGLSSYSLDKAVVNVNLENRCLPDDAAYVIYTSGSTGTPKGVMVEHRPVINRLNWMQRFYRIIPEDVLIQKTTFVFDVSVWELFWWSFQGASLCLLEPGGEKNPAAMVEAIGNHKVTTIHFVPSMLSVFLDHLEDISEEDKGKLRTLRRVFASGEALGKHHVGAFNRLMKGINGPGYTQLINLYGPTEATVDVSYYNCPEDDETRPSIPIGKPIDNICLTVMGKDGNLQPIGVPGELWISGDGLARGYLNRPELTAEKFITRGNELFGGKESCNRFYRTGDLTRWLRDGNIEFLGRIDFQVKIRGFRIELGEIENRLLSQPGISETIVMAKVSENGDTYLCAYIVTDAGGTETGVEFIDSLKEKLAEDLPEYMIPPYFVLLEQMPLNANGKADRKALPDPVIGAGGQYIAPGNDVEKELAEIWADTLKLPVEKIGVETSFFDLGGHSLKATVTVSRIHKAFDVRISLTDIFKKQTISKLAALIGEAKGEGTQAGIEKFLSIGKAEASDFYVLSSAQKRLFILQQVAFDSIGYNIPVIFRFEERPDLVRLENALGSLIGRHESLRTQFEMINNEPVQRILEDVDFEIETYHVHNEEESPGIIRRFIRPFHLSAAPLLRAGIVEVSGEPFLLMVDMHHIISDGVSMEIFVNELDDFYNEKEPDPLSIQYKDFARWQQDLELQAEFMARQKGFWLHHLEGEIPQVNLPYDFPRPMVQDFEGDAVSFGLDEGETRGLRAFAKKRQVTLFMVLSAAFNILLSKLSGAEDIIVGTPVAGRRHSDLEGVIGMFVNTLAIRHFPAGDKTVVEFLEQLRTATLDAFENQEYPFEELVEQLNITRDAGRNPIFDIMFVLQNMDEGKGVERALKLAPYHYESRLSKFDITLFAIEVGETLRFKWQYGAKLFKKETVERFIGYFRTILAALPAEVETTISQIEIISEKERQQILNSFNDTATPYPMEKTIHGMFSDRVNQTPDAIALRQTGKAGEMVTMTYGELDRKAGNLAFLLVSHGVSTGSIAAVMVERSMEMMVAIFAILKAGAAYLPMLPGYPDHRKEFLLKDSNAAALLTQNRFMDSLETVLETCGGELSVLDLDNEEIYGENLDGGADDAEIGCTPGDIAYVIYTSGSTGVPKGVMVEHRPVINRLDWMQRFYPISAEDVLLQKTTFVFDVSVWELFWWSFQGASLCLLEPEGEKSPAVMMEAIETHKVTAIHFVPSMLTVFLGHLENVSDTERLKLRTLRWVFASGEALGVHQAAAFYRLMNRLDGNGHTGLINLYGPTEATVDVSYYNCPDGGETRPSIPIGKPIDNICLTVVSKDGNLQPVGVPGELWISGDGLARGYLNRPELTDEKFITGNNDLSTRFYRTGDLTRWLPDGNIEFLGRIDFQVKIRGFRVELGEIETHLLEHETIGEAVAMVVADSTGDLHLCAYMVPAKGGETPETEELREYLALRLPDYMIPSYFVSMDTIPLTANGKVDRKNLPKPDVEKGLSNPYAPPRDALEDALVEIWARVLGLPKETVGIDDNFFQLGGHSMKATVVIYTVQKELKMDIPLAALFTYPVIRRLAAHIKEVSTTLWVDAAGLLETIRETEKKKYYRLSPSQKRLYVLQQVDTDTMGYNMPVIYALKQKPDIGALNRAFNELIGRQKSLRTAFILDTAVDKGEPVQQILEDFDFNIENHSLAGSGDSGENNENIRAAVASFIRPFDLTVAPLLRAGLLDLGDGSFILMLDMHHIISDGLSMEIFIKELKALYKLEVQRAIERDSQRVSLPPMTLQYVDYAEWRNSNHEGLKLQLSKQEAYWVTLFEDKIPTVDLPLDFHRPRVQDFSGGAVYIEVDREETAALEQLVKKENATVFMLVAALFNVLLGKLSGSDDILMGTPVACRRHKDLENIIGMFVNTLVLRNHPAGEKRFIDFFRQLKQGTLDAFDNQEYPFEELVDRLAVPRDAGRNPLFDIMLVMQTQKEEGAEKAGEGEPGDLELQPYGYESGVSKFDMTLHAARTGGQLVFYWQYCVKLFKEETMERFAGYFKRIISAVAADSHGRIWDIEMLSVEEKALLLVDFNRTATDFPGHKTLDELFREQVEKRPGAVALKGWCDTAGAPVTLSYGELNRRAGNVAYFLAQSGVTGNAIVGLKTEPSVEMLICMLGILKAGAAYLPISPDFPESRVRFMLNDTGAKILLAQGKHLEKTTGLADEGVEVAAIDDSRLLWADNPAERVNEGNPGDIAYIIYTSGTTGKPKGTLTTHTNVSRVVRETNYIDIMPSDRLLQLSNYAFDGSVFDIFGAFLNGAALLMPKKDEATAVDVLAEFIRGEQVTIFFVTTAFFNTLVDMALDNLCDTRKILFGGERVSLEHSRRAIERLGKGRVIHVYGPTETTVYATACPIDDIDEELGTIPIGGPIANTSVYVLDGHLNPVPIGVPGELYIGGQGVALGYLNNPELTSEKFIPIPAALYPSAVTHQATLYGSGDLVRWLKDGRVEFLGRLDQQVKIRGFRIEMGEIESGLNAHPAIDEVLVIADRDGSGETYLCAYIVPGSGGDETATGAGLEVPQLREYLAQLMPEYMIPAYFVTLKRLPLTANGKVDQKALPKPQPELSAEKTYTGPRNAVERQLVKTWAAVLGLAESAIGIDDNFFQLGGHSLKGTVLIYNIHKEFNVRLSLADLFKNPYIRALAAEIEGAAEEVFQPIEGAAEKDFYVLSSAQKRLYILSRMEPDAVTYNVPAVFSIEEPLDVNCLQDALSALVRRHESFRTFFLMKGGDAFQGIRENVDFELEQIDTAERLEGDMETAEASSLVQRLSQKGMEITRSFIRPFDLSRAPLLRARLVRGKEGQNLFMVDMHHIISDGLSMDIFLRELRALYEGVALPPMGIQYKDYAEWRNRNDEERGTGKALENFWLKQLDGELPLLNLPTDFPRPMVQSFNGDGLRFHLAADELKGLKQLARDGEATLFMVLAAVWDILLARLSGLEDIVFGTPVAGRRRRDIENIIGMFVNTVALRHFPRLTLTFREFLKELKQATLEAFENQDYPFEDLVEKLSLDRDTGRNPLFDVMFALQNISDSSERILSGRRGQRPGLKLRPRAQAGGTAKFDMTLNAYEGGDKLFFYMEYATDLFKKETVHRFSLYFKNIVSSLLSEKGADITLGAIDMIPGEEKEDLLFHMNDRAADYPRDKTVHGLFRENVENRRDAIALVGPSLSGTKERDEIALSYGELNRAADGIAGKLMNGGNCGGSIVGVLLDRSVEMVAAFLGILKAGAAYVPIDPAYPANRINYILADTGAGVLISQKEYKKDVIANGGNGSAVENLTVFDIVEALSEKGTVEGVDQNNNPDSLAYIIYTSGTTGRPKGVAVEHGALMNLCSWHRRDFNVTHLDRATQYAGIGFDASVWEIFPYLLSGASLYIIREKMKLELREINNYYESRGITVAFLPTQMAEQFLTLENGSLRFLLAGGDKLRTYSPGERISKNTYTLVNNYGPTENTVVATSFAVDGDYPNIPIGGPISNTSVYILHPNLSLLQPLGVAGELCIGGESLARGYLNNPELTAEKFEIFSLPLSDSTQGINQLKKEAYSGSVLSKPRRSSKAVHLGGPGGAGPWCPPHRRPRRTLGEPELPEVAIYKTGDLARRLPGGLIEFLGRIDMQVKIRGFRIELGEIENQLMAHRAVSEAVVIDRTRDNGDRYLCAYIVPAEGDEAATPGLLGASGTLEAEVAENLKEFLARQLPDYMIPSYFVSLEKIPMTRSDKVDRGALPEPEGAGTEAAGDMVMPVTDLEKKIAEIWKEVLSLEQVGIHDKFFNIGGNSLNVIRMNTLLNEQLKKTIPVVMMFRYATISQLASYIEREETGGGEKTNTPDAALSPERAERVKEGKQRRIDKIKKRRSAKK